MTPTTYYWAELKPDAPFELLDLLGERIVKGTVQWNYGEPPFFMGYHMIGDVQTQYVIGRIYPDHLKEHYNLTEVIMCPHHFGEFYPPDSYCDKCYMEEKDKL